MSKPPCLFHVHCGGISGTWEHVFPAALGGLRGDTRILCSVCQPHFGNGLDKVLPRELRHFNTLQGVVSRHRGNVPPALVTDQDTGQRFWLDERQQIVSAEPAMVRSKTDERGLEQRDYKMVGDLKTLAAFDKEAFLKAVSEASGKKFDVIEVQSSRPILMARPLTGDTSFGGEETFRSVARIALNYLAAYDPILARSPGLEPLKQWVREGTPTGDFVHFANPVGDEQLLPNHFEHGHRVALGFCAKTGTISARVTLFGVHELAIKLGAAPCSKSHITVVDIDPKAERPEPGRDTRQFSAVTTLEPAALGAFASDSQAILRRNQEHGAKVVAEANDRAWHARLSPLLKTLNDARGLLRFQQVQVVRRVLEVHEQSAFNLLAHVIKRMGRMLREAGFVQHAAFFESWIDAEDGDVVVGEGGVLLAKTVLTDLGSAFLDEMARGPIAFEVARQLLNGERGCRLAYKVVLEAYESLGPLGLSEAMVDSNPP